MNRLKTNQARAKLKRAVSGAIRVALGKDSKKTLSSIYEILKERDNGISSVHDAAEGCGLSYRTTYRLLYDESHDPRLSTLSKFGQWALPNLVAEDVAGHNDYSDYTKEEFVTKLLGQENSQLKRDLLVHLRSQE